MPIKVLGDNGTGTLGDVLFGMEWAVTNAVKENIAVMSMSLGVGLSPSQAPLSCLAVEEAVRRGLIAVAASGAWGEHVA